MTWWLSDWEPIVLGNIGGRWCYEIEPWFNYVVLPQETK